VKDDCVDVFGGAVRPSAAMTGSFITAGTDAGAARGGAPLTGLGVGSRPHRDLRFRSLGCCPPDVVELLAAGGCSSAHLDLLPDDAAAVLVANLLPFSVNLKYSLLTSFQPPHRTKSCQNDGN